MGTGVHVLAAGVRWLELPAAFLTRSLAHHASYRAKLVLAALSAALSVAMLVLVGRVVALAGSGFAERVGMSYTSYALSGALVHGLGMSALGAFRRAVRLEQLQGTLEHLLASGRSPVLVIVLAGGVEFVIQAAAYAALAALVVRVTGLEPPPAHALAAAGLYVLAMAGLGLASAGGVVVLKEGEPIAWTFGVLSGALGGVCFPPSLLPGWLATVGRVLPTTRALELVRASLTGPSPPASSLLPLTACAAIACVFGLTVLRGGLAHARSVGTLARY